MRIATLIIAILTLFISTICASAENISSDIHMGKQVAEVMTAKITVSDLRRSFDFYTKVIGLKQIKPPGIPEPPIDDPDVAAAEVCLNFSGSLADPFMCLLKQKGRALDREQAGLVWISFKTPDTRSALSRAKLEGFETLGNVKVFRGIVIGLIRDPDGYTVQFLQAASVTP